jgi:uncharacterized protein with PIN domain
MAGFDLDFIIICTKCNYSFNPYAVSNVIASMESVFNYYQQNCSCPKCNAIASWSHNIT